MKPEAVQVCTVKEDKWPGRNKKAVCVSRMLPTCLTQRKLTESNTLKVRKTYIVTICPSPGDAAYLSDDVKIL